MRSLVFTNSAGVSVTLDSGSAPFFIESLEGIDLPPVYFQSQKAPFQDGNTLIDQLFQPRTITIQGAIRSSTPLQLSTVWALRRTLSSVLNPKLGLGMLTYTYDGGAKKIACVCVGLHLPNKVYPEPWQRFQIQLEAPNPYWMKTTLDSTSAGLVIAQTKFPIAFPAAGFAFSEIASGTTCSLINSGDVPTPIVVTFTGYCVNPTLVNITTGAFIHILTTLALGETMIVNTAFGQKAVTLNRSGSASNGMIYLDPLSTFFQLAVGTNQMQIYDDSGSGQFSCIIAKYDLFEGV